MFELICVCIDDSKPNFDVDSWVKKGEFYRAKKSSQAKDITSDEISFIWCDKEGNKVIPNKELDCLHIKAKRFQPRFEIGLN